MLSSALEHYRRQQRITAAGLIQARRARTQGSQQVAQSVTAFQILAARDSVAGVGQMLTEQGVHIAPDAHVVPESVAGTASDGRPLASLFEQAQSDRGFDLMVATQLQDAARAAASLGIATRDGVGYVRMLNPPSCSRCAVQAGRWFKWNRGFQRHPLCDCRHIPARESDAGDLTTNPNAYFESLSPAEQERIFTKAGAQAVRDGADVGQVVNARRDMYQAQNFGMNNNGIYVATNRSRDGLLFTTEGTTTRGQGFRSLNERFIDPDGAVKTRIGGGTTYSQATGVRLMPESIYALAKDRDDALRLLKLNGFIY